MIECNGEIDRATGTIVHHGDSCKIHESWAGGRTEVKLNGSDIPTRYVDLADLEIEAAIDKATGQKETA